MACQRSLKTGHLLHNSCVGQGFPDFVLESSSKLIHKVYVDPSTPLSLPFRAKCSSAHCCTSQGLYGESLNLRTLQLYGDYGVT
jgi:hypothetical protein